MPIIDMHCDTISELYQQREQGVVQSIFQNYLHVDLVRMKKGDYLLQNFALFTDLKKQEDPFAYAMELLDLFYNEIESYHTMIGVVTSYEDILKNQSKGRMSAMLTLEEGGVCRGNLGFLRNFYRLGVRMMTLTWNYKNELAYPNEGKKIEGMTRTLADETHGLTETGFLFLEEMERLGMIVDLSHLSDAGTYEVLRYARRPMVASHSNARTLAKSARNLTDEMIRLLADHGGVAGINYAAGFLRDFKENEIPMSYVEDMVAHIKHLKKVGGIGCIGLGSDFDGIGCQLQMDSPANLWMLEYGLRKEGFTFSEIDSICYGNVLRLYQDVLKE